MAGPSSSTVLANRKEHISPDIDSINISSHNVEGLPALLSLTSPSQGRILTPGKLRDVELANIRHSSESAQLPDWDALSLSGV